MSYLLLQLSPQGLQLSEEVVPLLVRGAPLLLGPSPQRVKLRLPICGRAQQRVALRLQGSQHAAQLGPLLKEGGTRNPSISLLEMSPVSFCVRFLPFILMRWIKTTDSTIIYGDIS